MRRKSEEVGGAQPPAAAPPSAPKAAAPPPPPPPPLPPPGPAVDEDAIALDDTAPTQMIEAPEPDHADMAGPPPVFDESPPVPPKAASSTTPAAPPPTAQAAPPPPPAASPPPSPPAPPSPAAEPAASAQPAVAAPGKGAFTGEGQWRVKKSGLGLVYGPADILTVESWVRAERISAQDQYSLDGGSWEPPSQFEIIATKLGVAYAGPPRPEAFEETPAPPPAAPSAPPPAAPKPKPAAAPRPKPKPTGGGGRIEFDLPEDDFGPDHDASGGGGMLWKVAVGLLVALLTGGAAFYFLVLRVPENRRALMARLPAGLARQGAESLAGTLAPAGPVPSDESDALQRRQVSRVDPIGALEGRLPQARKVHFRVAVANLFRDTQDGYEQAIKNLQTLAEESPAEALPLRAFITLVQAVGVYQERIEGDRAELLTKADTLKDAAPGDAMMLDAYGFALLANAMTEEAGAVADQVLKSADDPLARYLRARARPPGIEDLERARELRSQFVAATIALAEARLGQGDAEGAKALAQEVLSRVADHEGARELLTNKIEPALAGVPAKPEKPPEPAAPDDPLALFDAARGQFDAGRAEDAEKLFIEVLDNYYEQVGLQRVALTHYYLGEIYRARGDFDLAKAHFKAALEVAPNFSKAQRRLDALAAAGR